MPPCAKIFGHVLSKSPARRKRKSPLAMELYLRAIGGLARAVPAPAEPMVSCVPLDDAVEECSCGPALRPWETACSSISPCPSRRRSARTALPRMAVFFVACFQD